MTPSVPPGLFNLADNEFRVVIDRACADFVERGQYSGLSLAVRRQPYDAGWEAQIIAALDKRRVTSERLDVPGD